MSGVILAVAVAAVVAGLVGNRILRRRLFSDADEGPSVSDILSQAITLAVLFMAFILVEASVSYSTARQAATAEADAVDTLFETAEYAPEPYRQSITGKVVCYARAIVDFEWKNMANGRAAEASVWSSGLRGDFKQLNDSESGLFDRLLDADNGRSTSRRARLEESTPTTSTAVYVLMLAALAISIAGYLLALGATRVRTKILSTILLATLLSIALLIIRDLERPFNGVTAIGSAAITDTRDDIAEDFVAHYGESLPCDRNGRRK